jgi:hypothetical protein
MKLAEALVERKAAQQKLAELNERLQRVAVVQEGDRPAEEPAYRAREHRAGGIGHTPGTDDRPREGGSGATRRYMQHNTTAGIHDRRAGQRSAGRISPTARRRSLAGLHRSSNSR